MIRLFVAGFREATNADLVALFAQFGVTEADINAEREMCQWYNAQYETLMAQIDRFDNNLIRSNGDYSVANNQQLADAVTANIDQSVAFQMLQAIRQRGVGNIGRFAQILVSAQAKGEIAEDQHGPAVAERVQDACYRAYHPLETL